MQFLSKDGKFFMKDGKLVKYIPPLAVKGDLINMDLDGNGDKTYRVLKTHRNTALCMQVGSYSHQVKYNSTSKQGSFLGGKTGELYAGSDLDIYLNTTWYNTLSDNAKAAIVPENITQYMYRMYDEPNEPNTPTYTYQYESYTSSMGYDNADLLDSIVVGTRNVFAIDLKDIFDYFGKVCITNSELCEFFKPSSLFQNFWLRSVSWYGTSRPWYFVSNSFGIDGGIFNNMYVLPAFCVDLSKISFTKTTEVIT